MVVKFFDNSGITELGKGTVVTFYISRGCITSTEKGKCFGCISSITGRHYHIPIDDIIAFESEV